MLPGHASAITFICVTPQSLSSTLVVHFIHALQRSPRNVEPTCGSRSQFSMAAMFLRKGSPPPTVPQNRLLKAPPPGDRPPRGCHPGDTEGQSEGGRTPNNYYMVNFLFFSSQTLSIDPIFLSHSFFFPAQTSYLFNNGSLIFQAQHWQGDSRSRSRYATLLHGLSLFLPLTLFF